MLSPQNGNMKYKLDSLLGFGKYRGNTVKKVLNHDPSYITWCLESIEWFDMSDQDREYVFKKSKVENHDYDYAIDVYDFCD